jgi:hypothetical protein
LLKFGYAQQAPTASLTTTTTRLTTCRTFFNIVCSVYRSYRPGQALFLANFCPFFALVRRNRREQRGGNNEFLQKKAAELFRGGLKSMMS